jgi:putative PIG3 family NAD(P)H quinone oxidoreductase
LEAAGEVVAIADDVTAWKVGDRVAALLTGGGYAEYVAVPAGQCLPWPEFPSGPATVVEAAALPETCCTVWSNVFEIGRLQPGESLLVHGGASGIGTTAIQLAVARRVRVLCTVGSDSKMLACKKLGAMAVFNYKTDDFTACVQEVTGGQGVNVILDIVGGNYLQKNLECLAYQGRLVTIATRGGAKGELDIGLMMRKQATVTGSLLRPRSVTEKNRLVEAVRQHVWPLVKQGATKPILDNVFPLAEASLAHARLESGDHVGKVVLKVTA